MRSHGLVDTAQGHRPDGHVCWAFQSRSEFQARAVEYLLDGVAAGEWIEYVGSGSTDALRAELAGIDGLGAALNAGAITVTAVEDFYAFEPDSTVVDPHAAVTARTAATEQAVAAGYTGFRAVVDATTVVTTPRQRAAFVRFEHLIDQVMISHPVTAMCGYNLGELGSSAVAELACLHPLTNLDSSFQLYARPDGALALAGTINPACADLFSHALETAVKENRADGLILDGQHLSSITATGLLELDHLARANDQKIVLRSFPPEAAQLLQQLGLTHLTADSSTT